MVFLQPNGFLVKSINVLNVPKIQLKLTGSSLVEALKTQGLSSLPTLKISFQAEWNFHRLPSKRPPQDDPHHAEPMVPMEPARQDFLATYSPQCTSKCWNWNTPNLPNFPIVLWFRISFSSFSFMFIESSFSMSKS